MSISNVNAVDEPIIVNEDAELLVQRSETRPGLRLFALTLVFCAQRSVVSSVIKSLMNGVTSQPKSCWSETSRANELSFSIIVSSKKNFLMRCALLNISNDIASPVIECRLRA